MLLTLSYLVVGVFMPYFLLFLMFLKLTFCRFLAILPLAKMLVFGEKYLQPMLQYPCFWRLNVESCSVKSR